MNPCIRVRLPSDLVAQLNNAALARRTAYQPVMGKARDEVVEAALRDWLNRSTKPVSPPDPGRP
jgi:hypothetical protein